MMKLSGQRRIVRSLIFVVMAALLLSCGGDDPEKRELLTLTVQSLDPLVIVVDSGGTWQLAAIATSTDGATEYVTGSVKWYSSDDTVATVNSMGVVTGISGGSAVITAVMGMTRASFTVNVRVLSTIQVLPSAPNIAKGLTQQFAAWGFYSDGSSQDITTVATWSSSSANASVNSATGLATGDAVGTAAITATYLGVSSLTSGLSATLTVDPAALVSIYVNSSTGAMTMAKGETLQFIANGVYSDASDVVITASVDWSTSNANASVSVSGLVTGDAVGTANIIATDSVTTISGQSSVLTINAAAIVSIAVTPNVSIANGLTQQFIAMATLTDSSTSDISASATWMSDNTAVATIDAVGFATSKSEGTAVINATSGLITSTGGGGDATLTVNPAVITSIAVTPTNAIIANTLTQQFIAMANYTDTSMQDITGTATWGTTDPLVATVSGTGLATSLSIGTTVINATSGSITSTDTGGDGNLTVTPALVSIEVDQYVSSPVTIINGQTYQFTATGNYDDLSTQDLTTLVTWGTTDTLVATVDNVTYVGNATSQGEGTAFINATYSGITSTDTLQDATLIVEPLVLTSITVVPSVPTSIANGLTQQFYATGFYNDSSSGDLTTLALWKSSNASVATITNGASGGLAASVSEGFALINATYSGVTSTDSVGDITLTVTPAVLNSIAVTPPSPSIANGTTQQFTATGTYTDASIKDITTSVDWSSSDPLVASIGINNGFAFAESISVSPVTISATDAGSGISNTASLTVTGTWKMVRMEYNQGMDAFINSTMYYDYTADPTGTTTIVSQDTNNVLPVEYTDWAIYNTSGDWVQWDQDTDGDAVADLKTWYIYNSSGKLISQELDADGSGDGVVDVVSTVLYNAAGFKRYEEFDVFPFDLVADEARYYYHDASGNLMREELDTTIGAPFEYIYIYQYDANGNKIYHGTDTTGDGVPEYNIYMLYNVNDDKIWQGDDSDGDTFVDSENAYSYTYDAFGNKDTMQTDIGNTSTYDDETTYYWLKM